LQLRWGWHRVERAMERGKFSLDAFLDRAYGWCVATLPVEPVWLGEGQRGGGANDSSTSARLRAVKRLALAGKGYCHRAGRAGARQHRRGHDECRDDSWRARRFGASAAFRG